MEKLERKRYFSGFGSPFQETVERLISEGPPPQEELPKYESLIGELLKEGSESLLSENRISGRVDSERLSKAFEALEKRNLAVRRVLLSFDWFLKMSSPEIPLHQDMSLWGAVVYIIDYSPVICLAEGWGPGDWDKVSVLEESLPGLPIIPFDCRSRLRESPEESLQWAASTMEKFGGEEVEIRGLSYDSLRDLFKFLRSPLRLLFHPVEYSWFRKLSRGHLDGCEKRSLLEGGYMGTLDECPLLVRKEVPHGYFYLSTESGEFLVKII